MARTRTGFLSVGYSTLVAEEEGFEPPRPFRALRFSRPPPSTTRPFLRRPQRSRNVPVHHASESVRVLATSDPTLGVDPGKQQGKPADSKLSGSATRPTGSNSDEAPRLCPVPLHPLGSTDPEDGPRLCFVNDVGDPSLPGSACRSRPGLNCQTSSQQNHFSLRARRTCLSLLMGWRSSSL